MTEVSNPIRTIAFVNYKGGTGKTTTCLSVAGFLAKEGHKVLVVDFDPQADATSGLGIDNQSAPYTVYDAVLGRCGYDQVSITQTVLETEVTNLHLVPSELDLGVADILMHQSADGPFVLAWLLKELEDYYDYILIDAPSGSGMLLMSALCAADHLVVPLDSGVFAAEALSNLQAYCKDAEQATGYPLSPFTVVLNRCQTLNWFERLRGKSIPNQQLEVELKKQFEYVFPIPESEQVFHSQSKGLPISHSAPNDPASEAFAKVSHSLSRLMIHESEIPTPNPNG